MNPQNEGFISRYVQLLFLLLVIVPVGLIVQYIADSRREARFASFEESDFYLVVLREKDGDIEDQIVHAVRSQCTLHSVQTFEDRELLRVECAQERLDGLPVPRYLQRSEFQEEDSYSVIYAIFAGSDSVQNLEQWLHTHGYESKVLLEREWRGEIDGTETVAPRRNVGGRTSQIEVAAYFWSGKAWNPRLNLWDGSEVKALHDLGDRQFVRWHTRYVEWLREAAQ
jgi:hypothetical protein